MSLSSDEGKEQTEMNAKLVGEVQEALGFPLLLEKMEILRVVSGKVGQLASWCEGCACHGDCVDPSAKNFREQLRRFRAVECKRRGRRAVSMAMGRSAHMQAAILEATDRDLNLSYSRADPDSRSTMKRLEMMVKERVVQLVTEKLTFWQRLPYRLLAIVACELPELGVAQTVCRDIARECIAENDRTVQEGKMSELHRVCRIFLQPPSTFRMQLDAFAVGAGELRQWPEL